MKVLLCIVLTVVMIVQVFSATVPITTTGRCSNGNYWSTTVNINEATGAVVSAAGIDCAGNAWSKNYTELTQPSGGSNPGFNIESQNASELTLYSSLSLTYQIIDLQTGNNVGQRSSSSTPDQSYSLYIASLPVGVYGVVGFNSSNQTVGFATFSN